MPVPKEPKFDTTWPERTVEQVGELAEYSAEFARQTFGCSRSMFAKLYLTPREAGIWNVWHRNNRGKWMFLNPDPKR